MKKHVLLFFTLFAATAAFSQEDFCKDLSQLHEAERLAGEQKLSFRANPLTDNYDIKYHHFEWTLDPAVNFISGTVTTWFEPTEPVFQQIHFNLDNALTVSEVKWHGASLFFVQTEDEILQIDFPVVLPQNQVDSLAITYSGVPTSSGYGAFRQSTHGDNVPIIWTLSEPYGARNWWPCKQDLNDKIDSIDIIVRTPQGNRVASNGLLVSELASGSDVIFHWKHRYPITAYLVAIGVTNYAAYSDFVPVDGAEPIEVLNYIYPENLLNAQAQTPEVIPVMTLYNDLFGLYPFAAEKYGHAQFGFGGGMEHQTMGFMGGFSHLLISHELAHQWFGDKVTCSSWRDIWLNEGFATYSEGLTYNFGLGTQNWRDWLQGKITHVTSQPFGSVYVQDTTDIGQIFSSRLSYSKGGMLLHMLRWKMGDEDFFQAIKNYLNDPELAYGYARTEDLQAHLEAQSGQNLDGFFHDWFFAEGFPSYQVNWEQDGENVEVQLGQTTSHNSVMFFEMPVPVLFKGSGQDSLMVFDHQFSGQVFEFSLPFAVEEVVFDPDLWLVSANNTINLGVSAHSLELENQVSLSPNPAGDWLALRFSEKMPLVERLEIFDAQGRRVQHMAGAAEAVEINVSDLISGIYALRIITAQGSAALRFMKK